MFVVIPSFLRTPVVPSLPYDLWQALVQKTVMWIRLAGTAAGLLTFAVSDSRLTMWLRRFGRFVPITFTLLPGVLAGSLVALRFDAAFETIFHRPATETGSYEIRCAVWTFLPQFLIAIASRVIYERWSRAARRGSKLT